MSFGSGMANMAKEPSSNVPASKPNFFGPANAVCAEGEGKGHHLSSYAGPQSIQMTKSHLILPELGSEAPCVFPSLPVLADS